ncbi:MAG TPA: AMIN domain-containing protein, partial [Candidatus Caenarcaniphilales bacterium]
GLSIASAVPVLVAQPAWAQVAQVTAVQLKPTPDGLEILLQTTGGASTLVQSASSAQGFIAEITNAQLRLPQGNTFRATNPTQQISSVTVAPLDNNRIQVVVRGRSGVPTGQVFLRGNRGLVVNLTATSNTAAAQSNEPATQIAPSSE